MSKNAFTFCISCKEHKFSEVKSKEEERFAKAKNVMVQCQEKFLTSAC